MKINKQKIETYCSKYNYSYKIFNNCVIITTFVDEWRIDVKNNKLLIFHMNKARNKNGKCQYHFQRMANDWNYVFDIVISRHQNYNRVYDKAFRINKILKQLHMA